MIFSIDVQYDETKATAAGILFPHWETNEIAQTIVKEIGNIAQYEPGFFYKRELPCIMSLLKDINCNLEAIVIDGYVTLGQDKQPGLGMHLFNSIGQAAPIIGVAKRKFLHTPPECEVFRGNSKNPLYVTTAGISLSEGKKLVSSMHGIFRIPTLLKNVDQLCRGHYTGSKID